MSKNGYALDLGTPIRHVATKLEGVAPAALSFDEIVEGYAHTIPSDLFRVQHHEGMTSKEEALRWIVRAALTEIGKNGKVVEEDGRFRFADGVRLENLRYQRRRIHPLLPDPPSPWSGPRDPFDPMSGMFSDNVGIKTKRLDPRDSSLAELRESLRLFGWLPDLPAIKDERGVVIVGSRRLAVATELGIEPVVRTVRFGQGDEADAERFKLGITSNLGAKPFTREERAHFAEYLYGAREWTQERIAEALNVSQFTISRDLRFIDVNKSTARGRPRKYTEDEERELAKLVFDEGLALHKAEREVRPDEPEREWATKGAITALERERGRREERQKAAEAERNATCECPNCGHRHNATT